MFSRKPRPPHCEDLTEAQVKMVRKILSTYEWARLEKYADTLLKKGWLDVCIAVAKNNKDVFKIGFFNPVFEKCNDAAWTVAIIPHIKGLSLRDYGALIATALRRFDTTIVAQIIEMQLSPGVRAEVILDYMDDRMNLAHNKMEQHLLKLLSVPVEVCTHSVGLMKIALSSGYFKVADALRDQGFDMAAHADHIKRHLGLGSSPHLNEALRYIEDHLPCAIEELVPVVEDIPVAPPPRYQRTGDLVSCHDVLPDGKVLTTVFNFAAAQQVIYISMGAQISAPAVVNFRDIENRSQLNEAAADYLRQNGNPEFVACLSAPLSPRIVLGKQGIKNHV